MMFHFVGDVGGGRGHKMEVCGEPIWGCFRVWCATCGVYSRETSQNMTGDALELARALDAEAPPQHRSDGR